MSTVSDPPALTSVSDPPALTSARDDAINLHRAFSCIREDNLTGNVHISFCKRTPVVNILAHRNATQRALIQQEYRAMYSEDLDKRLSSEINGNLKRAVLLWMLDPVRREATIVGQALRRTIVNLRIATEVLCSRTPSQIQQLKPVYRSMFGAYVENDIKRQASGDHKKELCVR
ncbi:Annexin like [Actinidia chinensis var. chinensis]|uniref:Annexin like n=1 Tax=Actinidia chinensis var. chinensis TaxID=1590841 RepID=A0A2R6P3Q2_ACTCC|nr:Annexin like [Actinidia chinensis var. chinensis]